MKVRLFAVVMAIIFSVGAKAADNLSGAQAMFIYNFLRHVKWPETGNGENFVIGVYGSCDTYTQLETYTKDRKIGTKNIVVKKITTNEEAAQCQLVFVPFGKAGKIGELKTAVGSKPVLIVSERAGTISQGSGIEFVIDGDKLKFKIAEDNLKQQQLVVSRALMDMAMN